MKRTFMTLLLASSGTLLWAQQTGTDSTTGTTGDPVRSSTDSSMQQNTMQQNKSDKWDKKKTGDAGTQQSTGNYNAYGAAVPSSVLRTFSQEVPTGTDAHWEQSNEYWRVNYKDNEGKMARRYYSMNGQSFAISLPIMSTFVPDNVMAKVQELYGDKVYDVTMMRSTSNNQSGTMMQTGANAAWSNNGTASVNGSATVNNGSATVNSNTSANMSNNGTTTVNTGTDVSGSTTMNTTTVVDPVEGAHYHVRIIENGTVRSEMINEDGSAYVAPTPTESMSVDQQGLNNGQQMNNNTQQWNNGQQSGSTNNSMNTQTDSTRTQGNWNDTNTSTDSTRTTTDSTNAMNSTNTSADRLQTDAITTDNTSGTTSGTDMQNTTTNKSDSTGVNSTTTDSTTNLNSVDNNNAYGSATNDSTKKSTEKMDKKKDKKKHMDQ